MQLNDILSFVKHDHDFQKETDKDGNIIYHKCQCGEIKEFDFADKLRSQKELELEEGETNGH